ncbi:hypothetical protein ENSA5_39680 [Enhygromyxa salina]|uniref:HNH endonuclease n=1 Tax=Enhygromyxa salina TaxID=215803 RepID=A0A2S9XR95_9BACT|nr:hypothetical protein [Enhygromyxa salina]PRP95383.1 hypothetical protein ENSA5_39680 [Enhygromyxa salina]
MHESPQSADWTRAHALRRHLPHPRHQKQFEAAHPDAIASFVARNPNELAPRSDETFSKVDHLTPKGAGGCPDNPGNLQPHDLLCSTCKMIDDTFGLWQANDVRWRAKWNTAFRRSGMKRRRLDTFQPSWW